MTKLHASTHAATKALADLKSLHSLARDNRDKLRAFQQRHATAEAPAWLDMALAAVWPEAPASSGRDLLKAMLVVGGEYVEWKDDSGTPVRWFADHPDDHLCRVGATTLSALGRSEGIKIEPLPGESVHSAYARSTRMSLEWLHDATQAQVAMVNPAVPRWGLPPSCRTLGTPAQVGVLLAAGPNKGALAALRLQAVHSRGAQLTLAPVPASICLLLDAEFGQMLEDLRACLLHLLQNQPGVHPLNDIALAWDLAPAVGEPLPLDAVSGDSAGAAFACAALQVLAAYAPPELRADLTTAHHAMGLQFMSAALTPAGGLRPVYWVNAKAQAIALLATWANRNHSTGQAPRPLYLANGQDGLDELPASFELIPVATLQALVQHMAQRAEPMSRAQQIFLQAWYAPAQAPNAEGLGPEPPDATLNPLVDHPTQNPVQTLRQAAMQGVARWQRHAGGRLRHQFVPMVVSPESGSQHGLEREALEPRDHLQDLLAALDGGSHKAYLLTGLPGAGKTVLLRRHMLHLWTQLLERQVDAFSNTGWQEVPVYIPLNRFPPLNPPVNDPGGLLTGAWWAAQARACVAKELQSLGWTEPLLAHFQQSSGADTPQWRWRWHLDGVNELAMPPDDPEQDRGDRARWVVQGFLDAFKPTLKPLLSVRSAHFEDPDWLTVNVLPWQPHHIGAYLQKFFGNERSGRLWPAFVQDPVLMELCSRPMHMHMQCELEEAGFAPLATDRASLYLAHLWLRLRRGLGHYGSGDTRPAPDTRLQGNDLLSAHDRKAIQLTQPGRIGADDLRRLPAQGLLLHGLMEQAEHQYWQDAEAGTPAQPRCIVAVQVEDIRLTLPDGNPVNPALKARWLQACAALGLLETDALGRTARFSHQSWGEFFASLRLLNTPPDHLKVQMLANKPGATTKWARAMQRPFAHLNQPVSAQAERQVLLQRVNQRWAPAVPLLQALQGRITVNLETLTHDSAFVSYFGGLVGTPQNIDEAEQYLFGSDGILSSSELSFDLTLRQCHLDLERLYVDSGIAVSLGVQNHQPWQSVGGVWQALIRKIRWPCIQDKVWLHLRSGTAQIPGMSDNALRQLKSDFDHLSEPGPSDVQEVLNLALQGLPRHQAEAWLQAWLAEPPHPQAWRVLSPAALAMRPLLEPSQAQTRTIYYGPNATPLSYITHLGLWDQPHPLLQHLRRLLLLGSVDAGEAARDRVAAAGITAALQAPVPNLAPGIEQVWRGLLGHAFCGNGPDLLLRLSAGLALGRLGDNIRYERHTVQVNGQPRTGIRLKAAHWLAVPASGESVTHHMGSTRFDNTQPAWLPTLEQFYFARTPVTMAEWMAFDDDRRVLDKSAYPVRATRLARWNNPLQPVTTLSWYEAQAFTLWAAPLYADLLPGQGFTALALPTEVQYESAVRWNPRQPRDGLSALWPHDPSDSREPSVLPIDLFNHDRTRWNAPAPVAVFSAALTPTGVESMGNVMTWCANQLTVGYQGNDQLTCATHLPISAWTYSAIERDTEMHRILPSLSKLMAVRGGAWALRAEQAQVATRAGAPSALTHHNNRAAPPLYDGIGLRWVLRRPFS
jgi:formylglycine-generating enzyme required for sulfatase activity